MRRKPNTTNITRRSFIRASTGAALATMTPLPAFSSRAAAETRIEDHPVVEGYAPSVTSAWIPKGEMRKCSGHARGIMESATDFSWLSWGDSILIKLALNSGNPLPATTDPWLLGCMIDLLKEKGAGEILVGDQSGNPELPASLRGAPERIQWHQLNSGPGKTVISGLDRMLMTDSIS